MDDLANNPNDILSGNWGRETDLLPRQSPAPRERDSAEVLAEQLKAAKEALTAFAETASQQLVAMCVVDEAHANEVVFILRTSGSCSVILPGQDCGLEVTEEGEFV